MKAIKTWVAVCLIGLCAAIAAVSSAATPPTPVTVAWAQFRHSNDNNAVIAGATAVSWKVITGGSGPISSSPTVSGNTLYIGNNKGYITAIDIPSGRIMWERHVSNPVMSAPLLYGNTVIVGEGNEDSPQSGQLYVGSGINALIALDQRSGANVWQQSLAGSAMPTAAIVDGTLVHHNGAGWFTALDPATGQQKYAVNLHSEASMTAELPIGSAVATVGVQDNAAFLINVADGKILWRTAFPSQASGLGDCPQVSDGTLILGDYLMPASGDYVPVLGPAVQHAYALDAKSGQKLWDVALEKGTVPIRNEAAVPLLSSGTLYFGSAISPVMHALDARTGRVLWTHKAKGPVKGGVVTTGGQIFFGDLAGYLWALDARSGKVIGSKKMGSGFNVGSPILVGRTLIQGSRVGTVYAVPIDDIRNAHDG